MISEITGISLWPPSSTDLKLLNYAIWGILEKNKNATSHPNIGSIKIAIETEWNKQSVEFLRHVNDFECLLIQ